MPKLKIKINNLYILIRLMVLKDLDYRLILLSNTVRIVTFKIKCLNNNMQ